MRKQLQRGFTLIELMVVIAIIAVLSTLIVSLSGRTYGANGYSVSEQVVSTMGWVKMRAVSTRRIQTVQVKNQEILVWQSSVTGFVGNANEFVQRVKIPTGVSVYDVADGAVTTTGNTYALNSALNYTIVFKPDGTATGGSGGGATLYVGDSTGTRQYRVLVYHATGSAYARGTW